MTRMDETVARADTQPEQAFEQLLRVATPYVYVTPLIIVFLFGARHFIRNIAAGALKG